MFYTNDPLRDFENYDADQEERVQKLPRCECCGDNIQQRKAVCYDGRWSCEYCEEEFWQSIREDFLETV